MFRSDTRTSAVGAVGVLAGAFVTAHRLVFNSTVPAVGASGASGPADHLCQDKCRGGDLDRLYVMGFLVIGNASITIGTRNADVSILWVFFGLLGVGGLGSGDEYRARPVAMAPAVVLATIACLTAHRAAPATANRHSAQAALTDPGPNELYQLGLGQLRHGHGDAARETFRQLLRQYPNAAVAPGAQYYLAEADALVGDTTAADSAYQPVVRRYPTFVRAAEALLKHAMILEADGRTDAAKAAFQEVVNNYPESDEAVLAKDRLREL